MSRTDMRQMVHYVNFVTSCRRKMRSQIKLIRYATPVGQN